MAIGYVDKMTSTEKTETLRRAVEKVLSNHLCGQYIRLCGEDILWDYMAIRYNYKLLAYTSKGIISVKYYFDETFNENLCRLVDKIESELR